MSFRLPLHGFFRAVVLWSVLQVSGVAEDKLPVLVTLKPIHSLAAGVMQGVGEPMLLLPGRASPHSFVLRPSDARKLHRAALVVWVGPTMESFLVQPLGAKEGSGRVVSLLEEPEISLLPLEGGEAPVPGRSDGAGLQEYDPHIWLSPANAAAIVNVLVRELAALDPGSKALYERNGAALKQRIDALDQRLKKELAPVQKTPFVVYHDAFRYFIRHFGLTLAGTLTGGSVHEPGVRRMTEVVKRIRSEGVRCLFSEPQASAAAIEAVAREGGVTTGVLDPLGADVPAGPDAWFRIMEEIADSLLACLAQEQPGDLARQGIRRAAAPPG